MNKNDSVLEFEICGRDPMHRDRAVLKPDAILEIPGLPGPRARCTACRAAGSGELDNALSWVGAMKARLHVALQAHRHLRGTCVLHHNDGAEAAKWWLKWTVDTVERRAGLRRGGRLHTLRHTCCSRRGARNVPMLTIKELAGHVSLGKTMRYMHLSAGRRGRPSRRWRRAVEALKAELQQRGKTCS